MGRRGEEGRDIQQGGTWAMASDGSGADGCLGAKAGATQTNSVSDFVAMSKHVVKPSLQCSKKCSLQISPNFQARGGPRTR